MPKTVGFRQKLEIPSFILYPETVNFTINRSEIFVKIYILFVKRHIFFFFIFSLYSITDFSPFVNFPPQKLSPVCLSLFFKDPHIPATHRIYCNKYILRGKRLWN